MRRSATKPHSMCQVLVLNAGYRHLRHRHVHVSLNNPEQVQVLHLITCYRNLSVHLIFQKQRDSR